MKSTTKCVQIDAYTRHIIHISLEFIIHTYKALESEITNRLINNGLIYKNYINPLTKGLVTHRNIRTRKYKGRAKQTHLDSFLAQEDSYLQSKHNILLEQLEKIKSK